jgi:hypothetical protein
MTVFKIGQDVDMKTPTVEVTVDAATPLSVGAHVFRLVVVDDAGNKSLPQEATIVVRDDERPTAVISPMREVPFGKSFTLDGSKSTDHPPGKLAQWIWTMVS